MYSAIVQSKQHIIFCFSLQMDLFVMSQKYLVTSPYAIGKLADDYISKRRKWLKLNKLVLYCKLYQFNGILEFQLVKYVVFMSFNGSCADAKSGSYFLIT